MFEYLEKKFLIHKRGMPSELPKAHIDWLTQPMSRFFNIQAAAGVFLFFFTVLALVVSNSSYKDLYYAILRLPLGVSLGSFHFERSLHSWINDAVMTLFFFLIALELKRELVLGELRRLRVAMLSIAAAVGGMLFPVCIYLFFLSGQAGQHGWGTVMSTDTAFLIGCLALLGSHVPKSLRIFMFSLAIVDDIGAIIAVAISYSSHFNWFAGAIALLGFLIIRMLAILGVRSIPLFFIVGACIWIAVDASGVHATITGVILGLMTPTTKWVSDDRLHTIMDCVVAHPRGDHWRGVDRNVLKTAEAAAREVLSPVERLELILHPWVGFFVMPLFSFANAGTPLIGANFNDLLTIAVFLGFVLGKPMGILLFSWCAVRLGIAVLPADLNWKIVFSSGMLAGIGFTMAMFIANLAYTTEQLNSAKLGILSASIFCAVAGLILLRTFIHLQGKRPIHVDVH